jgi:Repeat of unknown function (DUF5648)
MKQRTAFLALVAAALTAAAPGALAQSTTRGQALYTSLGCAASNCHGANPASNQGRVLNAAGSALAVEYSVAARADKQYLLNVFSSDPTASRDIAAWLATITPTPPSAATIGIVEYFHAAFGHYFVTGLAAEIAALDGGQFSGWARTGRSFSVFADAAGGQLPVCRFFTTAFAPKSSHFYTPFAGECDGLRTDSRDWQYEGDGFFVDVPDASGACASSTLRPVFRLYNNGQGGAPNHRYTTDAAVRAQMLANGWLSEGLGEHGVIFCVPT